MGKDHRTNLVDRLNDVVTLLGLLISHAARVPAASKNRVEGTMVNMVSSKRTVKSNSRLEAGPNCASELFEKYAMVLHMLRTKGRRGGIYKISMLASKHISLLTGKEIMLPGDVHDEQSLARQKDKIADA